MTTNLPELPDLLSLQQVQQLCLVGSATVAYWIDRRGLPAKRIGYKTYVKKQDLAEFIDKYRISAEGVVEEEDPPRERNQIGAKAGKQRAASPGAEKQGLTLGRIAKTLNVNHSTVQYWIETGKLEAAKVRGRYIVRPEDLSVYLWSRREKPSRRAEAFHGQLPPDCSFEEYCRAVDELRPCAAVLDWVPADGPCFAKVKDVPCAECGYFKDIVYPRVRFIDQIDRPAAIVTGVYIWWANEGWGKLCGIDPAFLIGSRVDALFDKESGEQICRAMGEGPLDACRTITAKSKEGETWTVTAVPMREPVGAVLLVIG